MADLGLYREIGFSNEKHRMKVPRKKRAQEGGGELERLKVPGGRHEMLNRYL